ncbi:MAG: hypothetical protein Q8O67_24340 [Deltaproteobacteria bacterium]|nr:hypothetical protein [Deltaproteobacteria bacterium]
MTHLPSLGVVASGIAHDVRGPVGVIIAVLHELEQGNGTSGPDLERLLEMARRSTRKLERTASTLDAIAQLERPLLANVDLCPMLNAAVDRMRSLERRSQVKVQLPASDAPTRVQVAPSLFPHALEELFGWSLRRNPSELTIEVKRPKESGEAVVVVVNVVGVHVLPASAVPFQDPLGLARQLLEVQGAGLVIEVDDARVLMSISVPAAPAVAR